MRKLFALGIMVILLAVLSLPASSAPNESYDIGVRRVVTIGELGSVVFNDTIRIVNSGTTAVSSIDYAVPRYMAANLRDIVAKDSSGSKLNIQRDTETSSPYYWVRVSLLNPLPTKGIDTIYISSAYVNLIGFLKAVPGKDVEDKYTISFSAFPTFKTSASSSNVTIFAVDDVTFQASKDSGFSATQVGGQPVLAGQMMPLPAMSDKPLSFNFTSAKQRIIRCDWAKRELEMTPQGDLKLTDSYQIGSIGRDVSSVKVNLPKDASDVMLYDELGILTSIPSGSRSIDVTPRFRTIRDAETMTFTLKYRIPAGKAVEQLQWWGLYNLNFDLISNLQWIVDKAEITVKTPQGLRLDQVQPKPTKSISGIYENQLVYTMNGISPLSDLQLVMKYTYLPFWAALAPMVWLSLTIVGVVTARIVLKGRKPSEITSEIPVDSIRRFVELYDERSALRLELDKIGQELARGAISRHEHRRRSHQIESRIDAIWKELRPVRSTLLEKSNRYGEIIKRIERAEAEMDSARTSETQLRSQYRSGRMSRAIFDEMSIQARRRYDRARETINSAIVTLREEAR